MPIDLTEIQLDKLVTHHVGNKLRDEKYKLSTEVSVIEESTIDYLLKYFLISLKTEEVFSFRHAVRTELNDTYSIVKEIFSNEDEFLNCSKSLAKLLYEHSMHPKIREGELNIAYFSNAILDDEVVNAIGIFKSESNVPFLKMDSDRNNYLINHEYGFELKGIDKACFVFDSDPEMGYRVLVIDKSNSSNEAQYWKNDFLNVEPVSNEYHQTQEMLNITKNFLTSKISEEFEVAKTDKIDLLNRSLDYFKNHENFERTEFEDQVLRDPQIIKSFENFDSNYRTENEIKLSDSFEISDHAVKRQSRIFKSVLKLDKNFHIYIHGNKELIKKGEDPDGRKYYKIYFENET